MNFMKLIRISGNAFSIFTKNKNEHQHFNLDKH